MTTVDDPFTFDHPTVQRIIDGLAKLNRKCTPQDCAASRSLVTVAEWYAKHYSGTFEYMTSMRRNFERWEKLTPAQASGTINCMIADYRFMRQRSAKQREPLKAIEEATLPVDLPAVQMPSSLRMRDPDATYQLGSMDRNITQVCHNGTFTIVLNEAGEYRTIRVKDAPESMGKPVGTQIAQYLSGADNETNYTGFAFIFGDKIAIWSKFKTDGNLAKALHTLLSADKETRLDYGEAYAIESGNCSICGRKLTVPASLNRGMGPVCAERLGIN